MTQQVTLYHACLAPDQATILGYSADCWGYIHVPYSCARAQDGLNGRLSIHMIYESIMQDWTLIQPILFDDTLTKAAEAAVIAPTEEPAEAGQDWASQDTWDTAVEPEEAEHYHGRAKGEHKGRSGFEPKIIGLLVHLYRYGASYNDHALWSRVRKAADKVYFSRDNVRSQVDQALTKRG
jgi:hypothetical protein